MRPRIATLLHGHRCTLGEAPLWDPDRERLLWVDILAGTVFEADQQGDVVSETTFDTHVGFLVRRRAGGYVIAGRDGFLLLDADGQVERSVDADTDPARRFNDGAATPAGTVLGGTLAYDVEPDAGAIWSFDGEVARPILDGVTIGNGMAWSSDGATLYFIDSGWGTVDAFTYTPDPDRLSDRRTVIDVPEQDGTPDGMVIDADGCLWVALYGGGQVRRYTPDGRLVDRILVPAPNVTSLAFIGGDLDRVAITTAAQGLDEEILEAWPGAGALFVADPGVRGVLPHDFVG